ncbi:uncharacterized protein [Argopecten irradians]|uniref:uncharacterized protein n=1 Tax=Argopecten irradians TaxID=31199 RepID=UPI00371B071B
MKTNEGRFFRDAQIDAIIQRIDAQEHRLKSLEKAGEEKDKKIEELEQKLKDVTSHLGLHVPASDTPTISEQVPDQQQYTDSMGPTEAIVGDSKTKTHDNEKSSGNNEINNVNFLHDANKLTIIGHKTTTQKIVRSRGKRVDPTSSGVAFSVFLASDMHAVSGSIIKYDSVRTDTRNAYNHGNGIYEVPVSGVYVFTWSTTSDLNGGGSICSRLMVNGADRSGTCADATTSDWDTATGLIVTSVNSGDHVYITSKSTGNLISRADDTSTFSGWRLF